MRTVYITKWWDTKGVFPLQCRIDKFSKRAYPEGNWKSFSVNEYVANSAGVRESVERLRQLAIKKLKKKIRALENTPIRCFKE